MCCCVYDMVYFAITTQHTNRAFLSSLRLPRDADCGCLSIASFVLTVMLLHTHNVSVQCSPVYYLRICGREAGEAKQLGRAGAGWSEIRESAENTGFPEFHA